jgi:hypothetical protein
LLFWGSGTRIKNDVYHRKFIDGLVMHFSKRLFFAITLFLLSLSACGKVTATQVSATEPEALVTAQQTETVLPTQTSQPDGTGVTTGTPDGNPYSDCGPGGLVDVGYYFKDINGGISPTQLVRFKKTDDNVRDYVEVISCLKKDEGWISDSNKVENGYENEIIFFDKNRKSHTYPIIIGGHYIDPYDPTHKDITASLNGIDIYFYDVQKWIDATRDHFVSNGSRQIGVDIYLDDTQGDLSKVLAQTYQFRETNLKISEALKTGEGYPDEVPDGFFLFATYSWLIQPD